MFVQRMRRFVSMVSLAAVIFLAGFVAPPAETGRSIQPAPSSPSQLIIIENAGQFDSRAHYLIEMDDGRLWLGQDAIWIQRLAATEDGNSKPSGRPDNTTDFAPQQGVNLRLVFSGGAEKPEIQPYDPQPAHISYFIGAPEQWRTDVPVWGGVRYQDIYPGVDLVFDSQSLTALNYGLPWRLEAEPGANLSRLRLRLEGAESLTIDQGVLHVQTALGVIDLPGLVDGGLAGSLPGTERAPSGHLVVRCPGSG